MNECCKQAVGDFAKQIGDKFGPLTDTKDPNTSMTEEQFGMFKVLMFMGDLLEKMEPGKGEQPN